MNPEEIKNSFHQLIEQFQDTEILAEYYQVLNRINSVQHEQTWWSDEECQVPGDQLEGAVAQAMSGM